MYYQNHIMNLSRELALDTISDCAGTAAGTQTTHRMDSLDPHNSISSSWGFQPLLQAHCPEQTGCQAGGSLSLKHRDHGADGLSWHPQGGFQEPGGEGGCLRPESPGQRAEEVQAVPGVKGPNPEMANKDENNASFGLSFPRKLWRIVEDTTFTSVHWNDKGDMVVIEADLFQMEVLQRRGVDQICETDSIKSFIHELNLYGFRKIRPSGRSAGRKKMMIYRNSNFQRDKPLLLHNIQRKGDPRTTAQPATGTTATPKRKMRVMATRRSPRLHHNEFTQEAGNKVQKGMPTACRTPSQCSFVFSDLWSMGSVASQAGGNHLPSEQGGPSGEGPSNSATSVPPATAGRDSPGELPESPSVNPDYKSVMTLYNTCYSTLMADLLVVAPDEALESEEEQGDSSDYKCTLCEQAKKKPNP